MMHFDTLAQAVDFISDRLESDDVSGLMSQVAQAQRRLERKPDFRDYFAQFVFAQLQAKHREKDLRQRYAGLGFPADDTRHKLGGHMAELGCLHIDFEKQDAGWSLHNIWICR